MGTASKHQQHSCKQPDDQARACDHISNHYHLSRATHMRQRYAYAQVTQAKRESFLDQADILRRLKWMSTERSTACLSADWSLRSPLWRCPLLSRETGVRRIAVLLRGIGVAPEMAALPIQSAWPSLMHTPRVARARGTS